MTREELAERLALYDEFVELCKEIKSKRITFTKISNNLNISKSELWQYKNWHFVPSLELLQQFLEILKKI